MKRAAVYLRVSSKGKNQDGSPRQDEANQEPDCSRLCAARGWEAVIFRERESGTKARPEWRAMLEQCRRGQFAAAVFWALDRTGRNRVQIAHDVSELARWGLQIASVQDAWLDQPAGPMRDLLLQFMAWVAEGERAKLIERTKAGLDRARAAGTKLGRRSVLPPAVRSRLLDLAQHQTPPSPGAMARDLKAQGLGDFKPQTIRTFLIRSGAA